MATKKELQEIVESSGNRLHSQVVSLLRGAGWTVVISPYYTDAFTDKPREIDIVAEKKFPVRSGLHDWLGTVDVRLFVECKYINATTLFWFDAKDKIRSSELVKRSAEVPARGVPRHHYLTDAPVAKLFSSKKGTRGQEYEGPYRAINQVLNAMIFYRNKSGLMPHAAKEKEQRLGRVSYPIIVCNSLDQLFRTSIGDKHENIEEILDVFQLEVNYAYPEAATDAPGRNEYFLIDVTQVGKLTSFVDMLEANDIDQLTAVVAQAEDNVRGSREQSR